MVAAVSRDAELLQRLRAGDEGAFENLVKRHHTALVRFARTFVRDAATAEEVVQDAWMALLEGVDRLEGRATVKTWLFRVVANRARTRAVKEARSSPLSSVGDGGADAQVEPAADRFNAKGGWVRPPRPWTRAEGPEHDALMARASAVLADAMERLPPAQRAVVLLRDVEGLSSEEACAMLDLTEANQRVLLHRARARLRTALEAHLELE